MPRFCLRCRRPLVVLDHGEKRAAEYPAVLFPSTQFALFVPGTLNASQRRAHSLCRGIATRKAILRPIVTALVTSFATWTCYNMCRRRGDEPSLECGHLSDGEPVVQPATGRSRFFIEN